MNINKADPIPQGKYVPATRYENLIFTAGMTPRKSGMLILSEKVSTDKKLEEYRNAVYQATRNALIAAQNKLKDNEKIVQILSLTVYVNAEKGFYFHSKIADFSTDYLYKELNDVGIAARAAIGVASLPENAPVEVQIICVAK